MPDDATGSQRRICGHMTSAMAYGQVECRWVPGPLAIAGKAVAWNGRPVRSESAFATRVSAPPGALMLVTPRAGETDVLAA